MSRTGRARIRADSRPQGLSVSGARATAIPGCWAVAATTGIGSDGEPQASLSPDRAVGGDLRAALRRALRLFLRHQLLAGAALPAARRTSRSPTTRASAPTTSRSGCSRSALALTVALLTTLAGFLYAYIVRFRAGRYRSAAPLHRAGHAVRRLSDEDLCLEDDPRQRGRAELGAASTVGLIDEPFTALLYSPSAVVMTLIHFLVPFAILPIYGSMRGISDIELEAARDLGAGRFADSERHSRAALPARAASPLSSSAS